MLNCFFFKLFLFSPELTIMKIYQKQFKFIVLLTSVIAGFNCFAKSPRVFSQGLIIKQRISFSTFKITSWKPSTGPRRALFDPYSRQNAPGHWDLAIILSSLCHLHLHVNASKKERGFIGSFKVHEIMIHTDELGKS